MEYLSWLFFCLTPFGFFCTENGTGMITGTVFLILGFVFKFAGNNSSGTPTATVKVEPQKFWEWHYKDRMRSTLAQKDTTNDSLMALKDKEARDWATTICGYHNAWVPPETTQEQIARANGVITEKMVEGKDRIQFGKYYAMGKAIESLEKENEAIKFNSKKWYEFHCSIDSLKHLRNAIAYTNIVEVHLTTMLSLEKKFGTYKEDEVWENVLSQDERAQSEKWVREYLERFEKEEKDKKNGGNVKRDYEYLKKYGFRA